MAEQYSGVVKEVGGPELGQSGNEKPRKIVISDSPDYAGKTFRIWGNAPAFELLQGSLNQHVTVEFNAEQRQGPQGPYTQNMILNANLGGSENGSSDTWGSVSTAPASTPPASSGDWSVPSTNEAPLSKDDYWERREATDQQRTYEIEAAWALHTILSVEGPDHGMSDEEQLSRGMTLILLKRRLASELGK